jgi:WD40 repeat protein
MAGDGSTVALEHPDGTVTLHDGCTDHSRIVVSQRRGTAFTLALSRDASTLAAAGSEGVRLWDTTSGRLRAEFPLHHPGVTCLEFTPDGRTLAAGRADGEISLFDLDTRHRQWTVREHVTQVNALAFSDDGRTLASLGVGDAVRLWDAGTGRPHPGMAVIPGRVCSMAVAPAGTAVGAGYFDGSVRVWDTNKGVVRATLPANDGPASALAFSPDGRTLACGGFETVRLWTLGDDRR